ncbi:Rhamnan synthesis F [Desulfocurvibacter africanus]|uniref:Rhamnan synthesis F n=1 Tax=Desulfocurvibacter africanus subsp. africanus str. Walvis Bay TaxID=690850 RepID=F3YWI3_DESAF|nr:Rhamnan synthesis F [Desulfocurvibacter africanus]EGJ49369.1 Rhamnan synthesis F [Desulfocurvibacter africanus subsp. africanus str. Walvis Bay]
MDSSSVYIIRLRKFVAWLCRYLPFFVCRVLAHVPKVSLPAVSRLLQQEIAFTPPVQGATTFRTLNVTGTPCSIHAQMHVQYERGSDFTGKRVALVAHWDPHGFIDPYVIFYMQQIRALGYTTVLISDRELMMPTDTMDWADAVIWRDCSGYDFTSWKGALEYYPSILAAKELLITNDSIFAPTNPLAPVHAAMDAQSCDFWGLTESRISVPHLQSYYLVFRPSVLTHSAFQGFWETVGTNTDRDVVIMRYELTLTSWLSRHGLIGAAYLTPDSLPDWTDPGPVYLYWRQLLRHFGFPCIKRDVLAGKYWWMYLVDWERELASTGYPTELIRNYFARVGYQKE